MKGSLLVVAITFLIFSHPSYAKTLNVLYNTSTSLISTWNSSDGATLRVGLIGHTSGNYYGGDFDTVHFWAGAIGTGTDLEPVINFFQKLSVQCKHAPAIRLGWQTNVRVIRVM
jgi:hypothetical protein